MYAGEDLGDLARMAGKWALRAEWKEAQAAGNINRQMGQLHTFGQTFVSDQDRIRLFSAKTATTTTTTTTTTSKQTPTVFTP